ncbi:MAG TPA: DUF1592 domain-containing protein, partial [Verrucomicrobiae bacterium]|nr:DUF1592 domain-containing protein [Verrucomicrobiae bacterium]
MANCLVSAVIAMTSHNLLGADSSPAQLDDRFHTTIQPFLQTYCVSCHGKEKPKADFDITVYSSMSSLTLDGQRLSGILDRIEANEMPPRKAKLHPPDDSRGQVVAWFHAARDYESRRNAGDPGIVLARRLNNTEYDYTIRDLTGVDIQPTREFPEDPSSASGFDNSGESLVMSPSLLKKYLGAAREVANHMYLKPEGFGFAPNDMLAETDRDQFCVKQIIDFYHRQNIDYTDYFQAAWRYKYRAALGNKKATLQEIAAQNKVSAKYLGTIWKTLEESKPDAGPLVKLQALWRQLPRPRKGQPDLSLEGCRQMRDFVVAVRKKVEPRFWNITAGKIDGGAQPLLIWKNVQYATHRMTFDPAQLQAQGEPPAPRPSEPEPDSGDEFGPGHTRLITNIVGDPDLFVPAGQRLRYEAAFAEFCAVFPDMFYKQERGRNYFDTSKDTGRYLSAGFHNSMGFFRDDQALYELILDAREQAQLDEMWEEMDFVASTTARMYVQYIDGEHRRGHRILPGAANEKESAAAAAAEQDSDVTLEDKIKGTESNYLSNAAGSEEAGIQAIKYYFESINHTLRSTEKARLDAEPSHLRALVDFAVKAYRRPLSPDEKNDLLAFYKTSRERDGLDHETAIRECLVSVLMSPDLTYRIDLVGDEKGIHPLSDYSLASRLSYFLWSSTPDEELLSHAAAGDLHQPAIIAAQAKRMLKDPRVRAMAVEFGGNWLDFRHFEEINTVDKERFPVFTSDLRQAMFEEPVRFLTDVIQNNRSALDVLYGKDTFVNRVLARHYGIPIPETLPRGAWFHVQDATTYGRGGILPMAVFLTKNAPGLRTSPVKRGNWVVKNVLGERIPPPPPVVPELPHDEAKLDLPLREVLARHRADPNCAQC